MGGPHGQGLQIRKVSANLARRSRSQRESVTSSMRRRLTCQEILSQEDSYELADLMRNALRGVIAWVPRRSVRGGQFDCNSGERKNQCIERQVDWKGHGTCEDRFRR
jgi:hypothetical protein